MSFPRTPNTALSAALEAADSSMAGEKESQRADQAGASSCLHAPATTLSCQFPRKRQALQSKGWETTSPQGFGHEQVPTQALGFPHAQKIPGENEAQGEHQLQSQQQLFSPKQLYWELLHPNSGPKTRSPTPVKIPSTSSKHKAGTSPHLILVLPHIKKCSQDSLWPSPVGLGPSIGTGRSHLFKLESHRNPSPQSLLLHP